jgi:hypothetical protein
MAVRVNEAGKNRVCRKVNDRDTGGSRIGDRLDPISCYENVSAGTNASRPDVDELSSKDSLCDGGRRRLLGVCVEEERDEAGGGEKN